MMWRWKREPKEKYGEQPVPINELDAYEREQARKRGDAFVVKNFGPPDGGDGFCGMAPRN